MSDTATHQVRWETGRSREASATRAPVGWQYAGSLLLVAAATVLAFVVRNVIAAPNLTLIYVLPVIVAASAFGWGPALVVAVTGVLAFDFFFTEPYFAFTMYSAADIWAAALLLVVAAIVATLAAQSRRRALEALRAQEQAEALQSLAHKIIDQRPRAEILESAVAALHQVFRAPAVIYVQEGDQVRRVASAGEPDITPLDEEAARCALAAQLHTRAETYPYDGAEFEFWPVVASNASVRCVIGVDFTRGGAERPEKPERFTDIVASCLAAGLALESAPRASMARRGEPSRRP